MKIGLISDIHSNLEGLQTVLQELKEREVDKIFCCGDIVGYGPDPTKCIETLSKTASSLPLSSVKGNHDGAVLGEADPHRFNSMGRKAINWTKRRLGRKERSFLKGLSFEKKLDDHPIYLVHGSPVDPVWEYIISKSDAYRAFLRLNSEGEDVRLALFGHSHIPSLFVSEKNDLTEKNVEDGLEVSLDEEKRYLINPGSVGQPRDRDWRTSFALLEVDRSGKPQRVSFHRREYKAEQVRGKILQAGLPQKLGDRLLSGI